MRLLLDTHIMLWWATDRRKISTRAASLISIADDVFVSSACVWELATKIRRGKLDLDLSMLVTSAASSNFLELPIRFRHAALVASLPPLHFDPFDRLLVAQAMCESLLLITVDKQLAPYSRMVQIV